MPLFRRLLAFATCPQPVERALLPLWPRPHLGQSIAEFAIVVPVVFLILLAIADLGRVYTSAVAVEAAGREAADFGAFDATAWNPGNVAITVQEMKRRACVAAKGSHLEGYAQSSPSDDSSCTNPAFSCTLERNGATADCASSGGLVGGAGLLAGHQDDESRLHRPRPPRLRIPDVLRDPADARDHRLGA
jgi:hypothetical protein